MEPQQPAKHSPPLVTFYAAHRGPQQLTSTRRRWSRSAQPLTRRGTTAVRHAPTVVGHAPPGHSPTAWPRQLARYRRRWSRCMQPLTHRGPQQPTSTRRRSSRFAQALTHRETTAANQYPPPLVTLRPATHPPRDYGSSPDTHRSWSRSTQPLTHRGLQQPTSTPPPLVTFASPTSRRETQRVAEQPAVVGHAYRNRSLRVLGRAAGPEPGGATANGQDSQPAQRN